MMALMLIAATSQRTIPGGGGGGSVGTMRMRSYHNGADGLGYGAWGIPLPLKVNGVWRFHHHYPNTDSHAGKCTWRLRVTDKSGVSLSDVELWPLDEFSTLSRRDFGGGYYVNGLGQQVHEVLYVEHQMEDRSLPDVLWSMLGMGYWRFTYSADGTTLVSSDDHPGEFPDAGEPDYANWGTCPGNPTTGRRWHMAYGVSGTGRGILCTCDDFGTWDLLSTFGFVSEDSEGALGIKPGTTNANTKLFYFARNNADKIDFWRSDDGGVTFPVHLQLPFSSSKWVAPDCFVRPDTGALCLVVTARESMQYYVAAVEFDIEILATLTSSDDLNDAVVLITNKYESNITSKPFASSNRPGNYGYFKAVIPPDATTIDDAALFGYDESPRQTGADGSAFDIVICDTIALPYEDMPRVKAYSVASQNWPNGSTLVVLGATSVDTCGEWDGTRYTAKKTAGVRTVCVNLPRTNNNGASITLEARKYLAATPNTLQSVVGTYTEPDGGGGTIGKLQFFFTVNMALGDVLDFYAVTTGATSTPVSQNQTTPVTGLLYSIDITMETPLSDGVKVKIANGAQSFTNAVGGLIDGTVVQDTHSAWNAGVFTVPTGKQGRYMFTQKSRISNDTSPRTIFETSNYEIGQESQNTRKKVICQTEEKNRGGAYTEIIRKFFYKLNEGESVKCWCVPYGANVDLMAGDYNSLEIEQV